MLGFMHMTCTQTTKILHERAQSRITKQKLRLILCFENQKLNT